MTPQELRERVKVFASKQGDQRLRIAIMNLGELAIEAAFPGVDRYVKDAKGMLLLDRPCYAYARMKQIDVPTREAAAFILQDELGIVVDTDNIPCNRGTA